MKKVIIFDTTLRDGEQAPGFSMTPSDKLKMALQLENLGVNVIEAGFAASSRGDFASVKEIADAVKSCSVASLSRANRKDIEAAADALKGAELPLIHTFIATSPVHMEYKLKMKPEDVLSLSAEMVAFAKSKVSDVEFSAEDAFRSDREFLVRVLEGVIKAGATRINIPDTVGYSTPDETEALFRYLFEKVKGIEKVIVSAHCHNDLGMAVANSIAALAGGAAQIECAVNGIGERAGNAALEEVVMAIATRGAAFGCETAVNTRQLYRTSKLLSKIVGVSVTPNKAIVGENAFAHEAGIHQHGVLANRETYEIMTPESVGVVKSDIVLGKHSGRHAFAEKIGELGFRLDDSKLDDAFEKFKALCDRKKKVSDIDLEALIYNDILKIKETYTLDRFVVNCGNTITSNCVLRLLYNGAPLEESGIGEGPVDAAYKAVEKLTAAGAKLESYKIRSVTEGEDALGEVTVKLKIADKIYVGRGVSPDVIESSILAYLDAENKYFYERDRQ